MNTYDAKKKQRRGMMKRKVSIINDFTVYKSTHWNAMPPYSNIVHINPILDVP
jgi:hypothetical protein